MLKIYGSLQCPDCVECKAALEKAGVEFEYLDFADDLLHLKEFLALRDRERIFDPVKESGKIGIPCILCPDGSVTLSWDAFI